MAGFIKTIIDGILEGLDQMAQDPQGPPQRRRVPQRAPNKQAPMGLPQGQSEPLSPFPATLQSARDLQQTENKQVKDTPIDLKQFTPAADKRSVKPIATSQAGVAKGPSDPAITARDLLQSPGGAREAMIASEILNRPEHRW